VTFAPSPPSSPRRVRFAEVTQIKRDTGDVRSGPTNYTRTLANHELYEYVQKPPSVQELVSTMDDHGIPNKVYQEVYYSKEADAPDQAREYGGILFRICGGTGISALGEWDGEDKTSMSGLLQPKTDPFQLPKIVGIEGWEYNQYPPSGREIRNWLLKDPTQTTTGDRRSTWASQVIY
jgi:DNA polymerase zeta